MASRRQIKKVVKAAQKKPKLFITLLIIIYQDSNIVNTI